MFVEERGPSSFFLRMERRSRRMERDEVKEEMGGRIISGIGGHVRDLASILSNIGGQRKHFDKEE